jgi:hypothetical protein
METHNFVSYVFSTLLLNASQCSTYNFKKLHEKIKKLQGSLSTS